MSDTSETHNAHKDIEVGLGLIASGMFRLGDKTEGDNPEAAADAGMAVVSTIRDMAFDFMRKAARKQDLTNA